MINTAEYIVLTTDVVADIKSQTVEVECKFNDFTSMGQRVFKQ